MTNDCEKCHFRADGRKSGGWAGALAKFAVLAGSIWAGPMIGGASAQGSTAAAPSHAGPKAVLELFTSQGCSSCPPADALMQNFAARKDLVALTFHVDYWDYLGWKDTLANPKFSSRQRSYAKHRGDGRIYTPQMVINGAAHSLGSSEKDIDNAIAEHEVTFAKSRVSVQMRMETGQIVIETGGAPEGSAIKDANIWLAMVQREVLVQVRSGENRGQLLKYYNIVRELTPIGMWSGQAMTIRLDRDTVLQPGAEGCAVLIQSGKAGRIIGAAQINKM